MKFFIFIALAGLTLSAFSQSLTQKQLAHQTLLQKGEVVLKFNVDTKDQINLDLTKIMSIDKVTELPGQLGFEVLAYANAQEFEKFLTRNIPFEVVPKMHPKALTMATTVSQMSSWDRYPIYSVYEQMMASFASTYPTLCDIDTILSSTPSGNYRILVARISDNVNTAENEPQFLYSSSMHGDETTGFYLMLRMINYLLSNYGTITQVTNLVNGAEIWICPLANPEGTYYNSSPAGSDIANSIRGNLSGVDLNRNYKDPLDGDHPDGYTWQAETQAFMTFAENHHFNMSANFHGGAEVMNYPWDAWTTGGNPNADAAWWERVCTNYVTTARAVTSGYMTDTYSDGVTEGGDWYTVSGGRQDFMNYFHQCREATIELDGTKTTPTENLNGMWNTNYQSLLNFMQESLYGIRGIVTDSCSGLPVRAKVFANSYDQANDSSHVYSALPVGNYHKYVNTGTYSLTFSAPGYSSKTITGISVTNGTATVQNVSLSPFAPNADFVADVTNTCTGLVQFTNTGTYPTGCTFSWTFGDGNTSSLENPLHAYISDGTYTVKLKIISCAGNDSLIRTSYIVVDMPDAPTTTGATACAPASVSLTASGTGTIRWYDAITGGNLVGTGSTWSTPVLTNPATYYAENEVTTTGADQHAGKSDNSGSGNYYTNTYSRALVFDVYQDLTLKSVKVYVNTAGKRTILLKNSAGTIIDSTSFTIPTGSNPYTCTLNFNIPVGTDYSLGLLQTGNSNNMYYNTGISYPYQLAGVMSITGNNNSLSPNTYYYYYDWIVSTQSTCNSARTAAIAQIDPLPVASFTTNISTNTVDFTSTSVAATGYSWDFGDGNTSSLQNPSHTYAGTGSFSVTLVVTNNCGTDSITQTVTIVPEGLDETDSGLSLYPNPASGETVTLEFTAPAAQQYTVRIFASDGKLVIQKILDAHSGKNTANIGLGGISHGVYWLELSSATTVHRIQLLK